MSASPTGGTSQFRREREKHWRKLEQLLDRVEKRGLDALEADEALRLPQLYRQALSSLAVARATSLDRNLLGYLEALSARAFLVVHGSKASFVQELLAFFAGGFPRALRAAWVELALATACLAGGTLVGSALVLRDPELFHSIVGAELASGRGPECSAAELRAPLYSGAEQGAEQLSLFAGFLFQHNAQIGLLCFALGLLAGVPVPLLLVANGLMLGAFDAIYRRAGLAGELWAWLAPHGVTELLGVALGGTAGFLVARAVLFPGELSRGESARLHGARAAAIAGGAVALFFVAALIEGIFRQRVHDVGLRTALAVATAGWWIFYFGWVGRRSSPGRGASAA